MRLYTLLETTVLRDLENAEEYTYKIVTDEVTPFEDWVVAGIKFYDEEKGIDITRLFTIYIYNLREGFKIVDVAYQIYLDSKEIFIQFTLSEREEEMPEFQDTSIDKFLANVIETLKDNFDGEKYSIQDLNVLDLIQKIGWMPEMRKLCNQRRSLGNYGSILYLICVGIVCIGLLFLGSMEKKEKALDKA